MKHTPQLEFHYDDTPRRAMRISELLREDERRTR